MGTLKKNTLCINCLLLYCMKVTSILSFFFGGGAYILGGDMQPVETKLQLFPKHFSWDYYLELPPSTMPVDHLNLEFTFTLKSWWSRINQIGQGFRYIFGVWSQVCLFHVVVLKKRVIVLVWLSFACCNSSLSNIHKLTTWMSMRALRTTAFRLNSRLKYSLHWSYKNFQL